MNILSQVAKGMQAILTGAADIIAFNTGFIQRLRKFTGSVFVQTLVFGWLSNPKATLEELTQTAATLGISITPQGLDKRFTSVCAHFIKQVLEAAVATVIAEKPVAIPVLQRFNGVYIQDSSTITLPDLLAVIWKGCGGSTAENTSSSIKTQIRLNLNTGELIGPYLQSGKENDLRSFISERPLPKGSLWIADLGYFSLSFFKGLHSKGIYWLSRVKSLCDVYYLGNRFSLLNLLEEHCHDNMDIEVMLGAKERVDCRLLAVRVPDEVAKLRRCKIIQEAQRKGRKIALKSLKVASFSVLCCNIPYEMLNMNEAFVLMRTRWQIELIFKLWKNHGCIDEWRSKKPWRIMCEVYAKLIAMIIQHWILLLSCWQYPDRSLFKAVKTIKRHAMNLASAFASGYEQRLHEVLETIQRCLSVGCRINKRKTKPHNYQLLLDINDIP
jgi:hypothetical protein